MGWEAQVKGFVNLHVHGEYSLLDGLGTAVDHAEMAAEIGAGSLALTDHGNLSGALHHIKECTARGVKPIVGVEAYFREERTKHREENRSYYHLLLLAKDEDGWHSLMRLTTEAWASGFYYKPCVDWALLKKHSKGVIATTSCLSGIVAKAVLGEGDPSSLLQRMKSVFRDDLFVEIQPHAIDAQVSANAELVRIASEHSLPLVATTDAHYPRREWSTTHDVLVMSRTGQSLKTRAKAEEQGDDYMAFTGDTFYQMTRQQVMAAFKKNHPTLPFPCVEEAVDNTVAIAESVKPFEVDKSVKLPTAKAVLGDAESLIRTWCEEGLVRIRKKSHPAYRKRMEHELKVLRNAGTLDYFAIIGELVRWAKDNGILVGSGRGSAAGSLVAYLTKITAIDPIGHGLLFERFMNPDRKEMPDIDIDFQHDRRAEVVEHLRETWGADRVANVAAFQTYGMSSAVQTVARVLNIDFMETKRVTDTFETSVEEVELEEMGNVRLEHLIDVSPRLKGWAEKYPEAWQHAIRLEGQVRVSGKHPAGVVVTDKPVSEYMPTMRAAGGQFVTAWSERASFPIITEHGFLKIDVLALDDLTIKAHAARLIKEFEGVDVDFYSVKQFPVIEDPRDVEPDVIAAFASMHNLGVFQFESRGISALLKDVSPDWLGDVTAVNALYRPGPMEAGVLWSYAKRKHGRERWKHLHPAMAQFLDETYGIITYQEQVMQIAQALGGFSASEADEVRKVMTKWHSNKLNTRRGEIRMNELSDRFLDHATSVAKLTRRQAESVWAQLQAMTRYGFNKSHSACYSLGAYQGHWLKHHWPKYLYAALLTYEPKKKRSIIREAVVRGVVVLPPSINSSGKGFTVTEDGIRFGLDAVKDVGVVAVREIVRARFEGGKFTSVDDVRSRCTKRMVHAGVVRALEEAGAFDEIGGRATWNLDEMAEAERNRIDVPLSLSNRAQAYDRVIRERVKRLDELDKMKRGDDVIVGGEITDVKVIVTKTKKEQMAFVSLAFGADEYRVTFFPREYSRANGVLVNGQSILVFGKLDRDLSTVLAGQFATVEAVIKDLEG